MSGWQTQSGGAGEKAALKRQAAYAAKMAAQGGGGKGAKAAGKGKSSKEVQINEELKKDDVYYRGLMAGLDLGKGSFDFTNLGLFTDHSKKGKGKGKHTGGKSQPATSPLASSGAWTCTTCQTKHNNPGCK